MIVNLDNDSFSICAKEQNRIGDTLFDSETSPESDLSEDSDLPDGVRMLLARIADTFQ